ncbi:hypothetical protein D3C81_1923360 [compost metagenome]
MVASARCPGRGLSSLLVLGLLETVHDFYEVFSLLKVGGGVKRSIVEVESDKE